jgi:hypothetical protein
MQMNVGEFIPIVAILSGVAFAWLGYKHKELMVKSKHASEDAEREAAEKSKLEARLAVLERIVTDRGIQTADQIDALRKADTDELRSLQG